MSDGTVEIKITGSLDASLKASTAEASAAINGMATQTNVSASAMSNALKQVGGDLSKITPEMLGVGTAAEQMGKSIASTATALGAVTFDSLQGGIDASLDLDRNLKSASQSAKAFTSALSSSAGFDAARRDTAAVAAEIEKLAAAEVLSAKNATLGQSIANSYAGVKTEFASAASSAAAFEAALAPQVTQAALAKDVRLAMTTEAQAARALGEGLRGFGVAADTVTISTSRLSRSAVVLSHALVTGQYTRIPGELMVAGEAFGHLSLSMMASVGAAAAMTAGLGYLLYETLEAQKDLDNLTEAFKTTGRGAEYSSEAIRANQQELRNLPNVTHAAADGFMQFVAAHAQISAALANETGQLLPAFRDMGDKAGEAVGKLALGLTDLTESGFKKMNSELLNLAPEQYAHIQNLIATGQEAQAVTEILKQLSAQSGVYIKSVGDQIYDTEQKIQRIKEQLTGAMGSTVRDPFLEGQLKQAEDQLTRLRSIQTQGNNKPAIEAIDLADKVNDRLTQREKLTKEISDLEKGLALNKGNPTAQSDINAALSKDQAALQKSDNEEAYRSFQQTEQEKSAALKSGSAQRIQIAQEEVAKAKELFGTESSEYKQAQAKLNSELRTAGDQRAEVAKQAADKAAQAQKDADRAWLQDIEQTATKVERILQRGVDADNQRGRSALENKKRDLDQQVADRQISADQELQVLVDRYGHEADLEIAALKAHQQANADNVQVYDEDAQKILSIYQWLFNEIDKLQHNSVNKQSQEIDRLTKEYEKQFRPITSGFNTMIRGMLSGQETLGQAVRQGLAQMLTDFIMNGLQRLENWIMTELAMTSASAAGDAARGTAHDAAMSVGSAKDVAAGSAQIMNDAYKAAAGTYQSVAQIPYVGWILAPVAAGAAFAAVAAFDTLTSFDVGTSYVPKDMQANVHAGEIIVPRTFSDDIRAGKLSLGGSGGPGQSGQMPAPIWAPQVRALDGKSVAKVLKNRRTLKQMAKAYGNYMALNPSSRGAY